MCVDCFRSLHCSGPSWLFSVVTFLRFASCSLSARLDDLVVGPCVFSGSGGSLDRVTGRRAGFCRFSPELQARSHVSLLSPPISFALSQASGWALGRQLLLQEFHVSREDEADIALVECCLKGVLVGGVERGPNEVLGDDAELKMGHCCCED